MRNVYLVCYDVADDKRLRKTYKKMCGFGVPVQYSVFRCELSPTERQRMKEALMGYFELGQGSRDVDRSWPGGRPGRRVHRVLGRPACGTAATCGGDCLGAEYVPWKRIEILSTKNPGVVF